ncbi:SDR family NAD(P)-dependent oxidoreductase [Oceanicella actignis]|uniref:SDR family NAD(P)-dependent oxidoreductase n=1 Tax=Oceanicella actignis TaxID=1189325 RepID=UPI0011E892A7|nr:SDR family NAD(P)-dependent oxidoreductase [Oceanicella actignis]TYO90454.1 short-subunit dehydrogenase [Oceanicella actignis]
MSAVAGLRWWIVGASSGLGRALALEMARAGAEVIASARSADALAALAGEDARIAPLPLDVTDPRSVAEAAARIGAPDGVIYAAGAYEPMRAQDWRLGVAEAVAEVNFIGALTVLSHVVPGMAERGAGRVVLIGSLAGFRGLPGAIGYGASKAALMHLAENLRADLAGSGVTVQQVNPGFIRTRLTARNDFHMPQIMTPEEAARRTLAAIRSGRFSTSFPAPFAWLFTLGRFAPLPLFHALFGGGAKASGRADRKEKKG